MAFDALARAGRNDAATVNLLRARFDYAFKQKILDFYAGQPLTFQ